MSEIIIKDKSDHKEKYKIGKLIECIKIYPNGEKIYWAARADAIVEVRARYEEAYHCYLVVTFSDETNFEINDCGEEKLMECYEKLTAAMRGEEHVE